MDRGAWPAALHQVTKSGTLLRDFHDFQIRSVAQSCLILFDPMDCTLPSYSVHGILQAIILEWVAILVSRGSS